MECGVTFVARGKPRATRFAIHILAAMARREREMIPVTLPPRRERAASGLGRP